MCILKAKAQWSVKRQISQGYKEKPKMSKLPQTGEVNLRVGVGVGVGGGGGRRRKGMKNLRSVSTLHAIG